jgi:hypothetical protein
VNIFTKGLAPVLNTIQIGHATTTTNLIGAITCRNPTVDTSTQVANASYVNGVKNTLIDQISRCAKLADSQTFTGVNNFFLMTCQGITTPEIGPPTNSTNVSIFPTLISGNITIGGSQTGSAEIIMGPTPRIRQVLSVGSVQVENVVGNASTVSSLSTTFNYKKTTSNSPLDCYLFTSTATYMNQYCELIVSGSNSNVGCFSAKFMFSINKIGTISVQGFTTIYNFTINFPAVSVDFTFTSTTAKLTITTPTASQGQSYITTLIAYPTCNLGGPANDYSITAI